jgi:hypothetical protein
MREHVFCVRLLGQLHSAQNNELTRVVVLSLMRVLSNGSRCADHADMSQVQLQYRALFYRFYEKTKGKWVR